MPILQINDCTIRYQNGRPAVSRVSLTVKKGEIVSIVGESGSGKTTLIRAIMGLLPAGGAVVSGEIFFRGKDLLKATERELRAIRGRQIAMIFQDVGASMDPIQKIGRQYRESLAVHERRPGRFYDIQAADMLRRMQLTDTDRILDAYPFELSGGMKQRVGLAMGMTSQPALLLADEPTSALDVTIQAQVVRQLRQLRDQYGTAMVLVTHNMGVASYLSDRIGVMRQGRMIELGPRNDIIFQPKEPYTRQLLEAVPKLSGK